MDTQCNKYQLTINNPIEKGYTHEHIKEIIVTNFQTVLYFCMADEEGSCSHTHVFLLLNSRVRFSMVKRYFPDAHIEACRGSISDNVNYVKKTGKWELDENKQEKKIDGTFEEVGKQPPDSRGKRADMSVLYQMIDEGLTNAEILATNQDYILQLDKLDKVRTTILTERYKNKIRLDLECTYIQGRTGVGKSRGVLEEHGYESVYRVTDYLHPFDSYACQPVIVFEEFHNSLSIQQMLLYCDIYPIELPCRYANKYACFEKIYIISNIPLERQYEHQQMFNAETWEAFIRRIKRVITYDDDGNKTIYNSAKEYLETHKGKSGYDEIQCSDF